MKICVLASGSKGNATLIISGETKIIIDLGTNSKYIENALKELEIEPNEIDAIFITHDHIDHIYGLDVFTNRFNTKVYADRCCKINIRNNQVIQEKLDEIIINDLIITSFINSHDAKNTSGFIIKNKDKSICYITDTGYINQKSFPRLSDHDAYIMESNHDVEKLMNGNYPFHLKQRILGDKGHLSNKDAIMYLNKFITDRTKVIFFIHLSEENNHPELLLKEITELNFKNKIIISEQKKRTEMIEL